MAEIERFYLFDVGVTNHLARRKPRIGSAEFANSFEHLVLMELMAYRAQRQPGVIHAARSSYAWRTSRKGSDQ